MYPNNIWKCVFYRINDLLYINYRNVDTWLNVYLLIKKDHDNFKQLPSNSNFLQKHVTVISSYIEMNLVYIYGIAIVFLCTSKVNKS